MMVDTKWELLDMVSGAALANMVKGLLEAQGISVVLSQEGIGESIYPVAVGPLSEIQLLVPSSQIEEARRVWADYNAGNYENLSYPDENGEESVQG